MDSDSLYQETLQYLYGFIDYSLTHEDRYAPENFDLGRMRDFLDQLGRPQDRYPIIHLTGTKGKGSVAALCTSVLMASGYRVGLYTSPHLSDYAERIQVDRQPIPHRELVALVDEVRPLLDQGTELTTFEITTALALLYFARQGATAVVLEVGLGGRLDATNVVIPDVSVIASISYDHTLFLGNTLTSIAHEKAGIIKPGVPVVAAPQTEEARRVIEQVAAKRGSPLTLVERDYGFSILEHDLDGQFFEVWPLSSGLNENGGHNGSPNPDQKERLFTPLLGAHQVENAVTAYAALKIVSQNRLPLSTEAISSGFASVFWPARLEILQREPLVVIDSAHNQDSARRLSQAIEDYFPNRPVTLIFGASEDKNVSGMLEELSPHVDRIIAVQADHPRAMDTAMIVELADSFGCPVSQASSPAVALDDALLHLLPQGVVLGAGSLFVAAGIRESWQLARISG